LKRIRLVIFLSSIFAIGYWVDSSESDDILGLEGVTLESFKEQFKNVKFEEDPTLDELEEQLIVQQKLMEEGFIEVIERHDENDAFWIVHLLRLSQVNWVQFIEANCEYESST